MPSDEKSIEQQLGTIEMALRKNLVPDLYRDFNIGFQILKSKSDEDKAAGVRVFRLNNGLWLFAPIFFVDGEARGENLLYIKDKDLMVPFTEEWILYLMSKNPMSLGVPRHVKEEDANFPDLSLFQAGGFGGMSSGDAKISSLEEKVDHCISKWAQQVIPKIDFRQAVKEADERGKAALMQLMLADRKIAEFFIDRLGGLSPLRPRDDFTVTLTESGEDVDFSPTIKKGEVEVIVETWDDGPMSEEETEKIKRDRYVVRDNREDNQLSRLLDQSELKLLEPQSTGIYKILLRDSVIKELLVIAQSEGSSARSKLCLVDTDDKSFSENSATAIHEPEAAYPKYWEDWYEKLNEDEIRPAGLDASFILVGPNHGEVLGPFRVYEVTSLDNGQKILDTSIGEVVITRTQGRLVTHEYDADTKYVVPSDFKAIKVERKDIPVMSRTEAHETLYNVGEPVEVTKEAQGEYVLRGRDFGPSRVRKPSAVEMLVESLNLSETDALSILKRADEKIVVRYIVKRAAPPPPMGLPLNGPAMMGAPPMPPSLPSPQDPGAQKALEMIQSEMAGGNQPEVLELAALGSILGASDSSHFIDKWVGDMLTCMDRLGKTLFDIYWNYEDRKEELGQDDLSELEDQITNVFTGLGDLILNIRQLGSSRMTEVPFSFE